VCSLPLHCSLREQYKSVPGPVKEAPGAGQVVRRRDLEVGGGTRNDEHFAAGALDELDVVGGVLATVHLVSIDEDGAAEALGGLGVPDLGSVGGIEDAAAGVGDLDGVDGGMGEDGGAVPGGGEGDVADGLPADEGPGGVMDEDEGGLQGIEADADGVLAAGAAGDEGGDLEGSEAGAVGFADAVDPFGGEDDGDFADEGEGGEGAEGMEEEGGAGEGDEGFGELGAQAAAFAGGGQDDARGGNLHGRHI